MRSLPTWSRSQAVPRDDSGHYLGQAKEEAY